MANYWLLLPNSSNWCDTFWRCCTRQVLRVIESFLDRLQITDSNHSLCYFRFNKTFTCTCTLFQISFVSCLWTFLLCFKLGARENLMLVFYSTIITIFIFFIFSFIEFLILVGTFLAILTKWKKILKNSICFIWFIFISFTV